MKKWLLLFIAVLALFLPVLAKTVTYRCEAPSGDAVLVLGDNGVQVVGEMHCATVECAQSIKQPEAPSCW